MQHEMPWYESAEDATFTAIKNSKMSIKSVACKLWPSLKADSAYARLKDALKEDRPAKLTSDEHIFIANLIEQYDYVYYVAAHCHHSRPEPVEPQDEALDLDREINETLKSVETLLKRRERLNLKPDGSGL